MDIKKLIVILSVLLLIFGVAAGILYYIKNYEHEMTKIVVKKEVNPFGRLDKILKKKKRFKSQEIKEIEEEISNYKSVIKKKIKIRKKFPLVKKKQLKYKVSWSDSSAYTSLFAAPQKEIRKSYRQVMNEKADEISRIVGFNRSFSYVIEDAFRNTQLKTAEKLFKNKNYKKALELFKKLGDKSDNLMVRAMAWSYIMKIYDEYDNQEMLKAARANLAIYSARVAKKAFPSLVDKMGAKSPAVKKAFDDLIKGGLIKFQ